MPQPVRIAQPGGIRHDLAVMTTLDSDRCDHAKNMEGWMYEGASRFRQTMARQGRTLTSGNLVVSGSHRDRKPSSQIKTTLAQKVDSVMAEYYLAFDWR
jgi:hypothetical protein